MKTPEYDELLCTQIKNTLEFAQGDEIMIYLNPSDADKKTALEDKTGAVLTVSNRDFIGGTRAVISSRSILIDNSFLTRINEAKSSFTL
jgi:vacuolar-type H+-ATPase subunit E/Vma4